MIDVLNFVFQSFWTWAGSVILVAAFGVSVSSAWAILRGHGGEK